MIEMHGFGPPRALLTALLLALTSGSCGDGPAGPGSVLIRFGISTRTLTFGPADLEQTLRLENRGQDSALWRAETSASWLTVLPASGTLAVGETQVAVRVDRAALDLGTNTGQVLFYFEDAPVSVEVTAEHIGQAIPELDPTSASLGPDEASAAFTLKNVGEIPFSWSAANGPAWVTVSPTSGTVASGDSVVVTLAPDRSELNDGTHQGTVTLATGGGPLSISLSVSVASPAKARFQPGSVDFGETRTAFTVSLHNDGGRDLTWSAVADDPWVKFSPASGTVKAHAMKPIPISVSRSGLVAGEHQTSVHLTSNGGAPTLAVRLEVEGPAPPPPPPPPPGSVALAGRVTDQFSGAGMSGLTVEFAGATAVTDATGNFSVPGTSSSSLQDLEVSGGAIHHRRTFARSQDTAWEAIPASFNMAAFNDIAREYEPRTIRWLDDPDIYIDTTPHGFPPGEVVPPAWISEIQSSVGAFVDEWSDGEISVGSVTVGSSPPAVGSPGTIVVVFDEDPATYPSSQTVGLAQTFWGSSRAIVSGKIWLRFSELPNGTARQAIFAHELGHTMGMGHMNGPTSSIMTPVVTVTSLTTFDHHAGDFVYGRSPGNTSPDTDSASTYVGQLAPAGRPVGKYEWVCGDPALGSPETTPPFP